MDRMDGLDKDYREKIVLAVWETILLVSTTTDPPLVRAAGKPEGETVYAVHNPECVDALIQIAAMLTSTEKAARSPSGLQELCDGVAERFREQTIRFRDFGTRDYLGEVRKVKIEKS